MVRSAARYPASKNTQRTLRRLLNAAGIDARGVVFLVELFANTSSAFTREVAARGGYSVRVCLPRSRTRRKGVRRRGTSTKRGRYLRKRTRPPPTLVRGRSYTRQILHIASAATNSAARPVNIISCAGVHESCVILHCSRDKTSSRAC